MRDAVLSLAKAAVMESLGFEAKLDLDKILVANPQLLEKRATFVTLNTKDGGRLRGCIGSLVAHRSLYEDIIHNAISAAKHDPRFSPLTKEEFGQILFEVSILSEPKEVFYEDIADLKNKIRPFIDGVILKYSNYQATFLPQVWEQLPNFDLFFAHLCQKAGLEEGCLQRHPVILTYQVQKYA